VSPDDRSGSAALMAELPPHPQVALPVDLKWAPEKVGIGDKGRPNAALADGRTPSPKPLLPIHIHRTAISG
jgi:hypothetical protein